MSNLNYTLGKDYLTFTAITPEVVYYLQSYDGLGITGGDMTTGSPYGPIYNPSDIVTFNTFAATFVLDENWEVYETLTKMMLQNAPLDGENYDPLLTDINLYLYNNTLQKVVAHITMYSAYIQSIQNVQNNYNTQDNTVVKNVQAIFKYQYQEFFRHSDE